MLWCRASKNCWIRGAPVASFHSTWTLASVMLSVFVLFAVTLPALTLTAWALDGHTVREHAFDRIERLASVWLQDNRRARRRCDGFAERAAKGDIRARTSLALCFLRGDGRRRSQLMALQLFTQAANLGDGTAHLFAGRLHLDGRVVPSDPMRALAHFHAAVELGERQALVPLGLVMPPSPLWQRRSCTIFARAAGSGDAAATRLLADCFAFGRGRARNLSRANALYREAADLGDLMAIAHLRGWRLVGSHQALARRNGCPWVRRAAKRGVVPAMRADVTCRDTRRRLEAVTGQVR